VDEDLEDGTEENYSPLNIKTPVHEKVPVKEVIQVIPPNSAEDPPSIE
jgi:hypothetical protein